MPEVQWVGRLASKYGATGRQPRRTLEQSFPSISDLTTQLKLQSMKREDLRVALEDERKDRRVRRRKAPGFYSQRDIDRMVESQDGKCASPWCDADISAMGPHRHIDHKTPLSRGGTNWPVNLQLLCSFCNCSKCDMTDEEWRASGGKRTRNPGQHDRWS